MAIHREKYSVYDGPRDAANKWWVVAVSAWKWMVGFTRTKILVPLLWIPSLISVLGAFLDLARRSGADASAPQGELLVQMVGFHQFACILLFMTVGPGIVSHDLRHKSVQLYFSKPLSAWEYGFGKWLALFMIGSVVAVGPGLVVVGVRLALLSQDGMAQGYIVPAMTGVGLSIFVTATTAVIGVGLSSVTGRTGFVVLLWILLLAAPSIAASILELAIEQGRYAQLVNFSGAQQYLSQGLMGTGEEVPAIWMSAGAVLGYTGLGGALIWWRLRDVEGAM